MWVPIAGVVTFVVAVLFIRLGFITHYGGAKGVSLLEIFRGVSFHWLRFTLYGSLFGLLWTGPWWIAGLALGVFYFRSISWAARIGCLWMALQLIVCIGWGGYGSAFAYRYLIGTYVAALLVWREAFPSLGKAGLYCFKGLLAVEAIYLSYLTFVYPYYWGDPTLSLDLSKVRNLVGVSPLGLAVFSCFSDLSFFARFQGAKQSALHGPGLWVLLAMIALAIGSSCLAIFFLYWKNSDKAYRPA
jgi:hypothetical protein